MNKPPLSGLLERESLNEIIMSQNQVLMSRTIAVAFAEKNFDAIRRLFENYTDITIPLDDLQRTALDMLIQVDDPEVNAFVLPFCYYKVRDLWRGKIQAIILSKLQRDLKGFLASINTPNQYGYCQLHNATLLDDATVVDLLLSAGADPLITIEGKITALHLAAGKARVHVIPLLVPTNGLINAVDASGATPLHHAMQHDDSSVSQSLLAAGANVNAVNAQGDMPLHLACTSGHLAQVRTLVKAKASRTANGSENLTPAELARQHGHAKILLLLEPQPAVSNSSQANFASSKKGQRAVSVKAPDPRLAVADQNASGHSGSKSGCTIL